MASSGEKSGFAIRTRGDSEQALILECDGDDDIVVLSINKDSDAEFGDVRDIVITRASIRWDVGLSMKHNHFAAKHSRLSSKIDFGTKWYALFRQLLEQCESCF